MTAVTDVQLQQYIDQVFLKYDRDRSGTLDANELAGFFNDLFQMMGHPMKINNVQAMQALKAIDLNNDGKANKMELFIAFRQILNRNTGNVGGNYQNQYPNQNYNNPYQNQGTNWGNQGQQQGWGANQNQRWDNQGNWNSTPLGVPQTNTWGSNPNQGGPGWGGSNQSQGWGTGNNQNNWAGKW